MTQKESGESEMDSPPIYCCLNAFAFSSGGKLKCPIALSFYGIFLTEMFDAYLKIETLLAIAATATIAPAIIVIVSIKQSPFFN